MIHIDPLYNGSPSLKKSAKSPKESKGFAKMEGKGKKIESIERKEIEGKNGTGDSYFVRRLELAKTRQPCVQIPPVKSVGTSALNYLHREARQIA